MPVGEIRLTIASSLKHYTQNWIKYLTAPSEFGGLDLSRAIAVIMVIVWHANMVEFPVGWMGVDLFFVLSGFLIFSIYKRNVEKGHFNLFNFYRDRFLRIYPTYITIVLIFACIHFGSQPLIKIIYALFAYATFTQTYLLIPFEGLFYPVTWTLVVEMLFYFVAPLLFLKLYPRRMPHLILTILLVFPIIRAISIYGVIYLAGHPAVQDTFKNFHDLTQVNWQYIHLLLPHFRFDALWYGVGVGYLVLGSGISFSARFKQMAFAAGLLMTLALWWVVAFGLPDPHGMPSMTRLSPSQTVWLPTISVLGYALMVFAIYKMKIENKLIIITARLAYPLYLVHMIVFGFDSGSGAMAGVFTVLASLILSYFVEFPFINYYKNKQKQAQKQA